MDAMTRKLENQTLLVIAPHPDDEVLGCGGLIKKIKDGRGKVYVLFLTVGNTEDFSPKGRSTARERLKEIEAVAKFLKYNNYHLAFEGDKFHLKLDLLGQKKIMDVIERKSPVSLEKIKPTIVAFPSFSSYNQDHQITAMASHAALRPSPREKKHFVQTVISYEAPHDLWRIQDLPEPNFFVPLGKTEINVKLSALKLYKSQLRPGANLRSPESMEALSRLRGHLIGSEYAEGYFAYRSVFKI